jgi:hypothetical protein
MVHPCRLLPALLFLPSTAAAQVHAWADVDVTRVESDAVDGSWGATLAPSLRFEPTPGAAVLVGAAYGRYGGDLWALQGTFDATLTPSRIGPLVPELSLAGAALTQGSGGSGNILSLARGRLHLTGARAGVWGGAGGGAGDDGVASRSIAFADLGGWASVGPATLSAALLPTSVDPGGGYLDGELALGAAWRGLEVTAGAGHRWWRAQDQADESWASVGLQFQAFRQLAFTATAGRFPSDPVRGFGDGRYLQFGARVGRSRAADAGGWALRQAYRSRQPIAPPVVRSFEVRTTPAARVFVVQAPTATRVELAGDFTDWEPLALQQAPDGTWRLERAVPAGSHRFNLRVDGGAWGVPPGVPTLRDDFGGVVGVLLLD